MMRLPLFPMEFQHAAGLDAGKVRTTNEDRVVCCPESGFFAVIDGMGGLAAGEQTADFLEHVLPPSIERLIESLPEAASIELAATEFASMFRDLSDSLFERTNECGSVRYGAAFSAVWLVRRCVVVVHMGDCRAYWMRRYGYTAYALTQDHNVAAELVAAGALKAEEAIEHVSSARLTRFMGMRAPGTPDMTCRRLNEGDHLLLCSDGLYREVANAALAATMCADLPIQERCDQLISLANQHGGRDNISAILISL